MKDSYSILSFCTLSWGQRGMVLFLEPLSEGPSDCTVPKRTEIIPTCWVLWKALLITWYIQRWRPKEIVFGNIFLLRTLVSNSVPRLLSLPVRNWLCLWIQGLWQVNILHILTKIMVINTLKKNVMGFLVSRSVCKELGFTLTSKKLKRLKNQQLFLDP